tara:strand:+ start:140 stop:700 length:561 start_codon:yes stop_codon:yes gene_type:complete
MITEDQWTLIDKRYGKLLAKICHNISGDIAISSYEDNLQDLRIATMSAVQGFSKKESKSFDEFWDTQGFNKYMKTCLWNLKNKKGASITKKYNITKHTVDVTEYGDVLLSNDCSTSGMDASIFLDQLQGKFTGQQEEVIKILCQDPTMLKKSGLVNTRKLSQELGQSWFDTRKTLDQIEAVLRVNL